MKLEFTTQQILQAAVMEARMRKHEYLTAEHILHASLSFHMAKKIIRHSHGNIRELEADLQAYLAENLPAVQESEPMETEGFSRVLQNAALHVASSGRKELSIGDIFAAMLEEKDLFVSYFLMKSGVTRLSLLRYISHGKDDEEIASSDDMEGAVDSVTIGKSDGIGELDEINEIDEINELDEINEIDEIDENDENDENDEINGLDENDEINDEDDSDERNNDEDDSLKPKKKNLLRLYTVDLLEKARNHGIDPLIGREDVLKRTMQILLRRVKNNPIHIGDPGVGKTAIVEGLAVMVAEGRVPTDLKKSRIFSLDMGALIAGTRYRGDFEERMKKVLHALEKIETAIVYIDEIHNLVGTGATSGGSMEASGILKPFLTAGRIKFIGSTTYEEYRKHFEKDRALSRRFQRIDILEPSIGETVQILQGLKARYEEHHHVLYTDGALQTAAELSARYIQERHLPDKAIDVMDETGALVRMEFGDTVDGEEITVLQVTDREIERTIASMAKIPEKSVKADEISALKTLDTQLKEVIFGQDEAVKAVVQAIRRSRAGFGEAEKPVASLLFVGPTGVGKTELTRQLAAILGVKLLRFDMSEYQEKHTVSRLIGSPPGYVGYEEGGLLTEAVRKSPYCVVLLDEIEKAHPDVYNVLLQIMDYGMLTDNSGKKADFHNVVLIMTSNAGAREIGKALIGFEEKKLDTDNMRKEVERIFLPEFRNRLDAVISFRHLDREMAIGVARKELQAFSAKLAEKNISLNPTEAALTWFADKGLKSAYGAREIIRAVQDRVKSGLVDEVLFGSLMNGGTVTIDVVEGELVVLPVSGGADPVPVPVLQG